MLKQSDLEPEEQDYLESLGVDFKREYRDRRGRLRKYRGKLLPGDLESIVWWRTRGMKFKEISERLDMPWQTCRKLYKLAIKKGITP
jgi:hypothetical protein